MIRPISEPPDAVSIIGENYMGSHLDIGCFMKKSEHSLNVI
jgi:hypothetical protein